MWYGVTEYLAVALVVPVILHSVIRKYVVASVATAVLSSLAYLAHEAWIADFQVNFGWVLPLFVAGFVMLCGPVGLAFSFGPRGLWSTASERTLSSWQRWHSCSKRT
jgi:hypothetical protein